MFICVYACQLKEQTKSNINKFTRQYTNTRDLLNLIFYNFLVERNIERLKFTSDKQKDKLGN